MIHAEIERERGRGNIRAFRIEGHALFAPRGKDIVCAGVSAVTVGTVNSIEALCGIELETRIEEGLLQASVPGNLPEAKRESLQLLLESMVVMLQTIEASYGKYIRLHERYE